MKKAFKAVIIAVIAVIAIFLFNGDLGLSENGIVKDIRKSQKIQDDWITDGEILDDMAAYISYPEDKHNHTFSVYVNRDGFDFGYHFRGGGSIFEIEEAVAEFEVENYDKSAFISMNNRNIVLMEIDDGNDVERVEIEEDKPFAFVIPKNAGTIIFYDADGNTVEYIENVL